MKQAFATDRATTQLTRSLATAGSESKLMRPGKNFGNTSIAGKVLHTHSAIQTKSYLYESIMLHKKNVNPDLAETQQSQHQRLERRKIAHGRLHTEDCTLEIAHEQQKKEEGW